MKILKTLLFLFIFFPLAVFTQNWSIKSGYSKKHYGHYSFAALAYEKGIWNFELGLNYFINVLPDDNQGYYPMNRGWAYNFNERFGIDLNFETQLYKYDKNRLYLVNNLFVNYIASKINIGTAPGPWEPSPIETTHIHGQKISPSFNWSYNLGLGVDCHIYKNLYLSTSMLPGIIFMYVDDISILFLDPWDIATFFGAKTANFTITYNVGLKYNL